MNSVYVPAVDGALPTVTLRPLSPGETGTIERVFAGMSAESRQMRFLAPVRRLGERALHRLADVDHDEHECWVAIVGDEPVGLGRYVQVPGEPGVAEVALDVVDKMQGRGLGKLLLTAVMAAAADAGVDSLVWVTDPANVPVRRLAAPWAAHFSVASGVAEARAGLPVVSGPVADEVVQQARAARLARREAT
jgi:RimJ/RimL family protein N-acetyltransferase